MHPFACGRSSGSPSRPHCTVTSCPGRFSRPASTFRASMSRSSACRGSSPRGFVDSRSRSEHRSVARTIEVPRREPLRPSRDLLAARMEIFLAR